MKKFISVILLITVILMVFASCQSQKVSKKEVVTDFAGDSYTPVTQKNGAAVRDESGNIIVLVTNESGKKKTDSKGEYVTESVDIDKALVMGKRIEMSDFSITIPDGWENNQSYNALQITKTEKSQPINLSVESISGKTADEIYDSCSSLVSAYKSKYSSCKVAEKTVTLDSVNCNYKSAYVKDIGNGEGAFYGFIVMDRGYAAMRFQLISQLNLNDYLDEILEIFNTIDYVNKAQVKE